MKDQINLYDIDLYDVRTHERIRKPALDDPVLIATNRSGHVSPEQVETLLALLEQRENSNETPGWPSVFAGVWFALVLVVGAIASFWYRIAPFLVFLGGGFVLYYMILFIAGLIGWLIDFLKGESPQQTRAKFHRERAYGYQTWLIGSVVGEVSQVWQHTVDTPDGPLFLWGTLLPGLYCFYYVKDESIVLSAEFVTRPKGQLGFEHTRQVIQQRLCKALAFSMTDLQANQQGNLSDDQLHRLSRRTVSRFPLHSIDGFLTIAIHYEADEDTQCHYVIDPRGWNRSFEVPCKALEAPVCGIRYRVYHLAEHLLSIEPLEALWWEPKEVPLLP